MFIAHSKNEAGQVHYLTDHSRAVARLAAQSAGKFSANDFGYWTGMLHDIGKTISLFQDYIDSPDTHQRIEHSGAGALFAFQIWEGLALVVAGHHTGLRNAKDTRGRIQRLNADPKVHAVIDAAKEVLPELNSLPDLTSAIPSYITNATKMELFIRFLFSALVDADFLDTEAHFNPELSRLRGSHVKLDALRRKLEGNHRCLVAKTSGEINALRQEIFEACCASADLPPGVFRLTVPTGGGKTRSGMAFALRHALKYSMDRVIVAIPYTSIIEQNADEYRRIFGRDAVLEHHSAVEFWYEDEDESEEQLKAQLGSENWDYPIVVTTTVQLFESLFANRPSRCRKLHNIARSVIILDEVQTLPTHLLVPILDVLQDLTEYYGVSVVLSTATQPALDDSPYLRGLRDVREIVPNPERYFSLLKRVEYELPARKEKWSWERVASVMSENPQCLTVVNTKKDAQALINILDDPDALHLSTLLCGAHRREVIAEVKRRLSAGRPCRLVSTQVIEAGVDLDFSLVLRAIGPLDRIVQAAGRCNREGRLTDHSGRPVMGRVIVFDPEDGGSPRGAYLSGLGEATRLLRQEDVDLHDPSLYRKYFERVYRVVETSGREIQSARESYRFAEVAERFRMIKENTVPVVVRYDDETHRIIASLRAVGPSRSLIRRLQPYLVNVYENQLPRLLDQGLVEEITPGLYEWMGSYDPVMGITDRARDPETLVF